MRGSRSRGWKPGVAKETSLVVTTVCSSGPGRFSFSQCGLASGLGWSKAFRSSFPTLLLGVSGPPLGKWVLAGILLQKPGAGGGGHSSQGQARRNWFFQLKNKQNFSATPFFFKSQVGCALVAKGAPSGSQGWEGKGEPPPHSGRGVQVSRQRKCRWLCITNHRQSPHPG